MKKVSSLTKTLELCIAILRHPPTQLTLASHARNLQLNAFAFEQQVNSLGMIHRHHRLAIDGNDLQTV